MRRFQCLWFAALIAATPTATEAADATCALTQKLEVPPQPGIDGKAKFAYGLGDSSQAFFGRFFIDADGAPKAYHRNNDVALDTLDNAGEKGNWWALATNATDCGPTGKPVLQKKSDPAPGYYVSLTSMSDDSIDNCRNPRKYVNAEKIPYVALSQKIRAFDYENNKGALALVLNTETGKRAFALFADQAPDYGFGEGSIALGAALGYDPSPKSGGTEHHQNLFLIFRQDMGFPKNAAAIETAAAQAFKSWGGEPRLQDCLKKLQNQP